MPALTLSSVNKTFGHTVALDNVTLDFAEHCITAIIGRSGCGKSTLLRTCNGLVTPESGTVQILGQAIDPSTLHHTRRKMGYAVQGTGLFPHLSVRENITVLASLEGWTPEQKNTRVGELLELTQLDEGLLYKYPHEISGGQQQRVGLCRAMMLRPEILLLDEPFAAIDPITRSDIHQQLLALHSAEPNTTVLVTHDIREAMALADHILVMESGRVIENQVKAKLLEGNRDKTPEQLLDMLMSGAN